MEQKNRITMKLKVQQIGVSTLAVTIPKPYAEHIGIVRGDTICMMDDVNKKGDRYIAIWKQE